MEAQCNCLRRAAAAGVAIATGSDAGAVGVPHGQGFLQERELLAGALGEHVQEITDRGNQMLREWFRRCV